jgi:hypothetical protein
MRTTLTLDDSLANQLKNLAHQRGMSFKEIVHKTLLIGLQHDAVPQRQGYQLTPVSLGQLRSGINLDKSLQLADDLEDSAILQKLEQRK